MARHGISYVEVRVFDDPDLIEFDVSRGADGEERRKVVGPIDARLFSVVFTCRKGRIQLISTRRTDRSEDRRYGHGEISS